MPRMIGGVSQPAFYSASYIAPGSPDLFGDGKQIGGPPMATELGIIDLLKVFGFDERMKTKLVRHQDSR